MKISRRDFLKTSTATTAAITLAGGAVQKVLGSPAAVVPGPGNTLPGRVVINFNKNALTGTTDVQNATIRQMVHDSILKLTGKTDIGEAWKSIFPATAPGPLTATSKIAIKVPLGCASSPCFPHIAHIRAIIDGLNMMVINGTKFNGSFIIYDAACGNNMSSFGFNTTNFPDKNITITYEDSTKFSAYGDGALSNRGYAKSLNSADFLINCFSPRGHSSFGLTLGFKNHFGTYEPNALHGSGIEAINCTGPIFKKTVMNVCSAIYANKENLGPGQGPTNYSVYAKKMDATTTGTNAYTLVMSTDPISAELEGIKIMRMNTSPAGGFTAADMPAYLQNSAGMGSNIANIGVIDEAKMDIRTILNQALAVNVPGAGLGKAISAHVSANHINGHASTFIQYALPLDFVGSDISFEIYNLKGVLVRKLSDRAMGTLCHFSWDEKDDSGKLVRSGNYTVRLIAGSTQLTTQLSIMR
jgi:hypothetical protein